MHNFARPSLRQFNNLLSLLVVGMALYILLWPFWPAIMWRFRHANNQPSPSQLSATATKAKNEPIPARNSLVIPRIELDTQIHEGNSVSVLSKGVWRRPNSSTPNKSSNTVLVGHRFTQTTTGIFYHLDKIKIGDPIVLFWEGKKYIYSVTSSEVVPASAGYVEQATDEPRLTLYTCTPLWSFKDRLVVTAKLQSEMSP